MTCTTCKNCHEEQMDHCGKVADKRYYMRQKLQAIKDFACVLGSTTSLNLPKTVSKFGFMTWNFLRDVEGEVNNLNERVYNLCQSARCLDNRITKLRDAVAEALNASALGNITFSVFGRGTSSGGVATRISYNADGSFLIGWDMADAYGKVGEGVINGIIRHKYTVNPENGHINIHLSAVEFGRAEYRAFRSGNAIARFKVKITDGRNVLDMQYNPYKSWTHTLAASHPLNWAHELGPQQEYNFHVVTTEDTWQANPTSGQVWLKYRNGNETPIKISNVEPCNIECKDCP